MADCPTEATAEPQITDATGLPQITVATAVPAGAGSFVYSVFARTGHVAAESGDYASYYDTLGTGQAITDSIGQSNGICPLGADGKVPAAYSPSATTLIGGWDAATNSPDLAAGAPYADGNYWIVTTAGSTDLNGETNWLIGDWALYSTSEPGNWIRVPSSNAVTSVFTRQGAVVATAGDYTATLVTATPGTNFMTGADTQAQLAQADAQLLVTSDGLAAHKLTVGDHTDVTLSTPQDLDLLMYVSGAFVNVAMIESYSGTVAHSSPPQALGTQALWTEIVPTTVTTSTLKHTTYAAGRIKIDYAGTGANPIPSGTLHGNMVATFAFVLDVANTELNVSMAINGTPIVEADNIRFIARNAGAQTTGMTFSGTLAIPLESLNDGDEVSLVYQTNNAVDLESFVLSIGGEPDFGFAQAF